GIRDKLVTGVQTCALPISFEREEADKQLARVLTILRRLRSGPVADRSPYLGLLTFQEAHADLFFGRDALVDDLLERVRRAPFLRSEERRVGKEWRSRLSVW